MGNVFLLVAFAGVLRATCRSLGRGFVGVLAVGYFNGIIRANYLSVSTTFMFDAAVLGLYLGYFFKQSRRAPRVRTGLAGPFVIFLMAWPALLSLIPINHYLVQIVALRSTVWFLPALLIATRLTTDDLAVISRGLTVLNLMAFAAALYLFLFGVDSLYPKNAITKVIFESKDVGGGKYHRIPSTFMSAHSYGGTMVSTLPFFWDQLAGAQVRLADRVIAAVGMVAAAGGLLMCGARYPLIIFGVMLAISWVLTGFSVRLGLVGAIIVAGGVWVALNNERFQRSSTLGDTEMVTSRMSGSANASFLQLLSDYPGGAGMGSSVGTSVPFFLAHVAPKPVGLENEFSRILVDQGWIGLGGWLALFGWLYIRPPSARPPAPWRLGVVFMYSLTLATWMTAFIGTGTLSAVPMSILLLTQMGVLVTVRSRGRVPGAVDSPPGPVRR